MAIPVSANTTCDIYRMGNSPPAAPDVAAVPCYVKPDWRGGQDSGNRAGLPGGLAWTHILLVAAAVDIRDAYAGGLTFAEQDSVYIPDQNGTQFKVIFIERVNRAAANDHKRVYLDRQLPAWPTDEV